jgi:hypothetical protein
VIYDGQSWRVTERRGDQLFARNLPARYETRDQAEAGRDLMERQETEDSDAAE